MCMMRCGWTYEPHDSQFNPIGILLSHNRRRYARARGYAMEPDRGIQMKIKERKVSDETSLELSDMERRISICLFNVIDNFQFK